MLTHLHISNFTLVDVLDLELRKGLTTLTGETGAGKSIMLDALSLALGARADGDKVRQGKKKADVHASFDIGKLKFARKWLTENELAEDDEDEQSECILRRVVAHDGRSRSFINGRTVTLQQLREFGSLLVDVHSQHEHQSLLKASTQRRLLDEFGGLVPLAKQVREAHKRWQEVAEKLKEVRTQSDELNARFQLLSYQVDELNQLGLGAGELSELEAEQATLANAEQIQRNSQALIALCGDEGGLLEQIHHGLYLLKELPGKPAHLQEAEEMLRSVQVQVQEAQREVERHMDGDEDAEQRLVEVETRLTAIYEVARKHRIAPEQLVELHEQLATELSGIQSGDEQLEKLETSERELAQGWQKLADELSQRRQFAASRLEKAVNGKLSELAMEHARFTLALTPVEEPSPWGAEIIEFLISTNPGQPARSLAKIASGGELSRISLAIQVVTALTSTTPTIIFDEVDVGVGGTTGDVVGNLLRELGENGQVICVTHLAQVASKAHHHLVVSKEVNKKGATSRISVLNDDMKIQEIARMMGGDTGSKQSIAHAKSLLRAV